MHIHMWEYAAATENSFAASAAKQKQRKRKAHERPQNHPHSRLFLRRVDSYISPQSASAYHRDSIVFEIRLLFGSYDFCSASAADSFFLYQLFSSDRR